MNCPRACERFSAYELEISFHIVGRTLPVALDHSHLVEPMLPPKLLAILDCHETLHLEASSPCLMIDPLHQHPCETLSAIPMMNGDIVQIHAVLCPIQDQREVKRFDHIITIGMEESVCCEDAADGGSQASLRVGSDHSCKSAAILDVSFSVTIPLNL